MTNARWAVVVIVGACLFAIAFIIEKYIAAPWRKRERELRQIRADNDRLARDIELKRQRNAAIKNGRTARTRAPQKKEQPPLAVEVVHREAGRNERPTTPKVIRSEGL